MTPAGRLLSARRANLRTLEQQFTAELGSKRDQSPQPETRAELERARRLYSLQERRAAKLQERSR